MFRLLAITCLFSACSVWCDFRVVGVAQMRFPPRQETISVPNPNPLVGASLARERRWSLPKSALARVETVRVCALRVQFQPDSTPTSTGTGQFDLSNPDSGDVFDPPPHDKKYFAAHLEALARYYRFVSHGKLEITYDIYPEADSAAYTLPDSMGYYGPSGWYGDDLGARVAGFFSDAVRLADSLDSIPFCEYDVVIVFHAGSDWQNDVASLYPEYVGLIEDFIPSPDDLPTAFIVLPDTVVPCVDRGIVLPEFCSQDGQTVLLNGVVAHEFGHALGLVDLYSTYDFYTCVGYMSLMDSGHNIGVVLVDSLGNEYTVYGALPVYPSAWERAYLGWEDVVELEVDVDGFVLRACELPPSSDAEVGATVAKVPIDEFEYFLLENRQAEPWGLWSDADVALKQDSTTGVIMGIQVDGEYVGAYDYLLPGSGVLVWHIDERIAYGDYDGDGVNNFLDNQLQWDWLHPFVKLEEADGVPELGAVWGYFGTQDDFFFSPHATRFGPQTHPATVNYEGGRTGIDIYDISGSDTLMSFSLRWVPPALRWRRTVGFPLEGDVVLFDLDGDGADEIMTTTCGMLLIWRAWGDKFVDNADSVGLIVYDGDTLLFPLPVAFDVDTEATAPSVGDIDGDGAPEIVVGDCAGRLWALDAQTTSARLPVCGGFPVDLGAAVASRPLLWDVDGDGRDEIIAADDRGTVVCISGEGSVLWRCDLRGEFIGALGLPGGDVVVVAQQTRGRIFRFDGDGNLIARSDIPAGDLERPALAVTDGETLLVVAGSAITDTTKPSPWGASAGVLLAATLAGDVAPGFPVALPGKPSAPALANLRSDDGGFQIVFVAETLLCCYNSNGTPCEGFPVVLFDDSLVGAPVVADADGDGKPDILFPSTGLRLYGFAADGEEVRGFPLSAGASVSAPAVGDIDGDGVLELFVGSFEGTALCWTLTGSEAPWGQITSPNGNRTLVWSDEAGACEQVAELKSFYNYPNPAGEVTYFRFLVVPRASGISRVCGTVRIYDESGNLIATLRGEGEAGLPVEIPWQTAGVSPGLYWALLEVDVDGLAKISKKHIVALIK